MNNAANAETVRVLLSDEMDDLYGERSSAYNVLPRI